MEKIIDVIYRENVNTTQLTITPNRVTVKLGNKFYDKYSREDWAKIAHKLAEVPVNQSYRGMIFYTPYGFYFQALTWNKKRHFGISYYDVLDEVIHSEIPLTN